jgi:hypothetical protein
MRLAMPEDVAQILAICQWRYPTAAQRAAAIRYELAELRRTQWERRPRGPTPRPAILRPSKRSTGYRTDVARHRAARLTVPPSRRQAIARMGAEARWTTS